MVQEFTLGTVQDIKMIFSCFPPCGKAGGIQIQRCQGIAVKGYGFTLVASSLNPSRFGNVGADFTPSIYFYELEWFYWLFTNQFAFFNLPN